MPLAVSQKCPSNCFFVTSFEYFLLSQISFVDFVRWIPLFLLHFISEYLHPKPEIRLIFFLQVTCKSVPAHHPAPGKRAHLFPRRVENASLHLSPCFLFP